MNKPNDWVIVAKFGRVHGVKGYISVHSYTQPADNILSYDDWFVQINNQWQLLDILDILDIKRQPKAINVLVKGYETREMASKLTHGEIAIQREQLPELEENEFYWHDLIGLNVINKNNVELGEVSEIMSTGANDVLVVMGNKRLLIPYLLDKVVLKVDLPKGEILVDWDEDF